jgi:hypothetical protein
VYVNYKWVFIFILIGIALICLEGVVISASADDSYVIVNDSVNVTITPTPLPTELAVGRRIMQGDCVAVGETVDIAGLGWYTGSINYYGRYYDGFTGDNSSWESNYKVASTELDHFYLDPKFFKDHLGWWYVQDDYYDESSNNRLFKVSETCDYKEEIQKEVIVALNESQKRAALVANMSQLPVRTEKGVDLIINKNINTVMDSPNGSQTYWMFGTNTPSYLYDIPVIYGNMAEFNGSVLSSLPSETYDTIFINPGKNGIVEETYSEKNNTISSPFRNQPDTGLTGISSSVARDFLINKISRSNDDSYVKWVVDIQDPAIYIMKLVQNPLTNNQSLIVLAGYTNENQGEVLDITFDTDSTSPKRTYGNHWKAMAINHGGQVAYRVWNVSFIVDFNQVAPGQHSFTVTSPSGAVATVPIYRRNELVEHYQPPEETAFFDNSPFIPTPTPIVERVVERETVKVIETVTVQIPPSEADYDNYVSAQHRVLIGEALIGVGIVVVLALAFWIGRSIYRSRRKLD